MPIPGLTDSRPMFPRIGAIRKGGPKTEKSIGKDLDYFRVEFDSGEKDAEERFKSLFGEQPKEITVVLPFNEIDRCWEAWNEAYNAGALLHRCDGVHVQYAIDPKTGEVLVRNGVSVSSGARVSCTGKAVYSYKTESGQDRSIFCRPVGRLMVIVPSLGRLAHLVLHTGSKFDIMNIEAQINAIRDINGGRIVGIPLILRRRDRQISTPGAGGKRVRRTKSLISIEADPAWVAEKIKQMYANALPPGVSALLPEAPHEIETEIEDEEEQAAEEGVAVGETVAGSVKQSVAVSEEVRNEVEAGAEIDRARADAVVEKIVQDTDEKMSAEMVVIEGKKKPAAERIGGAVASSPWFKSHIAGHKYFQHPKHFQQHLESHFGVKAPANLTFAQLKALQNHIDGVADDPRWYKPKEPKTTTSAPTKVTHTAEAGVTAALEELGVPFTAWRAKHNIPAPEEHKGVDYCARTILDGIRVQAFATNEAGLAEIESLLVDSWNKNNV